MRFLAILTLLWSTAPLAGEGAPEARREEAAAVELPRLPPPRPSSGTSAAGPGLLLPPYGVASAQGTPLQPLARERVPQRASQPERRSLWRPALVASAALAVTGAAVAYWSTDEADAAYDRYLRSAGARRQQQAFQRAERYDRIAGAAFVAMEAGIVLTACLVFF